MTDLTAHWDDAYAQGVETRSWFEDSAADSLAAFDRLGVTAGDSVIDVGSGAAPRVGALLRRGLGGPPCLVVSEEALRIARARLGDEAPGVIWVTADMRSWQPERTYAVWHDRAVLHFLTTDEDRRAYLRALHAATNVGSVVVLAAFAPDGPDRCSGLPVRQYDAAGFADLLGDAWAEVDHWARSHTTPWGAAQAFTWWLGRRVR